jgi:hypothetical protein
MVIAVLCVVVLAGAGMFWRMRHAGPPEGEPAYVGERSLTLWSRLAQVREPVASLHYGDRVAVVDHKNEQVQVRTAAGALGWTEQRYLLDAALWSRGATLREQARGLPVQARARTRVQTNLRVEAGRAAPRLYQFGRGVTVEILQRAVVEFSSGGEEPAPGNVRGAAGTNEGRGPQQPEVKKEDWVLVRGEAEGAGEIAGWVVRRFLDLEIPLELADYASGFHFVAWFELNRVPAGVAGEKPQFLAAGVQGGEGQPCDFTLFRVFTWGAERRRYETAYVESNFCARFPIRVEPAMATGADPRFSFTATGKKGTEQRHYVMHQTSVRRLRESDRARKPAGSQRR